jgi:hypothetical protein
VDSIIVQMSANLFVPASPIIKSEESLGKWDSGLCSCNFLFRESNIYIVYFKLTSLILTSVRDQFVSDYLLTSHIARMHETRAIILCGVFCMLSSGYVQSHNAGVATR